MLHLWKKFLKKFTNENNYRKLGTIVILQVNIEVIFIVPNEIPVVFHKGSNCNYHFIKKELAKYFEGKLECLEENAEKYKTFSVTIEKEVTTINKDGNESVATIFYKIKFLDSARFMATSLSNLGGNL